MLQSPEVKDDKGSFMYLFIYIHQISKKIHNFKITEVTSLHYKLESTTVYALISPKMGKEVTWMCDWLHMEIHIS